MSVVDPQKLAELMARAGVGKRTAKKLLEANQAAEAAAKTAGHGAPSAPRLQVEDL